MRGRSEMMLLWRFCIIFIICMIASMPARAHHQMSREGAMRGIAIPAIAHGEMLILAKYRARILEIAARQFPTDPTLRRLTDFVNLQFFACFWGLVPGSLSDERSPFNECSHAYLAGATAILAHVAAMPGDQSSAKELQSRIAKELASDPTFGALCMNSNEVFDSGTIIGPDWGLVPMHLPTMLSFSLVIIAVALSFLCAVVSLSRRRSSVGPGPR